MAKKVHRERVLVYGEIHLRILEAVDAMRNRWPEDTEEQTLQRLAITAQRILRNRRDGVAVAFRRDIDLTE